MALTKLHCPFCTAVSSLAFVGRDYNRGLSHERFHMCRCESCGLLFISNPPSDMSPFYETGTLPTNNSNLEGWKKRQAGERFKIDLVKRFVKSGILLDIGPNMGEFADLAGNEGFDVSVIECDPHCVEFMQENLSLRVHESCDPTKILRQSQETFDVICLWQAIEHLPEPWALIEEASKRLNEKGILVIATPNPHAWQLKVFRGHWPHLDMPRHRYLLPMGWVKNRSQERGLRVALVTDQDYGTKTWERVTWAMFLTNYLKPRGITLRNLFWRLGWLIGGLASRIFTRDMNSATYTIILRKEI